MIKVSKQDKRSAKVTAGFPCARGGTVLFVLDHIARNLPEASSWKPRFVMLALSAFVLAVGIYHWQNQKCRGSSHKKNSPKL